MTSTSSDCDNNDKSVYVIVLGDMGHSPRMCNHALSLAEEGFRVKYLGYEGSALPRSLRLHERVRSKGLLPFPGKLQKILPRLLYYAFKVIWQSVTLLMALPMLCGPDFILLQNPPSIPVLPLCYFYTLIHTKTKLIMDWHNYGYSILALSLGERHFLVRLSRFCERVFGPKAHASFCVSRGMKKDLTENWNVSHIRVLYDRPSEAFRPASLEEKHRLFRKLLEFRDPQQLNGTIFTEEFARGRASLREDRPGLLVSSTSWTEDEDFGLLLEALQDYEEAAKKSKSKFPSSLVCVITGKGPTKERYKKEIKWRNWERITVLTPWLEPEDYPVMLGCADLGVCLHKSSSGLDLPMKVVDMFGCGLPVAAVRYPALSELVRDGENGLIFDTSKELGSIIIKWFEGFPRETEKRYRTFSRNVEEFQCLRWADYWLHTAYPAFKS